MVISGRVVNVKIPSGVVGVKISGVVISGGVIGVKILDGFVDEKSGGIVEEVMTVSGGHVVPVPWKVTSARCTQLEPAPTVNCRPTPGWKLGPDMHTLTRESQEVTVGLTVAMIVPASDISSASKSEMDRTEIPYCGQLNMTTSTLLIPL